MLTVSTWHPPSAVSHSVRCNLTGSSTQSLVVAKITKLEVYDLTPTGLDLRCSFDTWGVVTSLLSTQRKGHSQSSLIVTTDHLDPKLYVLDFDSAKSQLTVTRHVSLKLRTGREAEFWSGAVIHPNGKAIVCCQYSGMIKVIALGSEADVIVKEFDCQIPELNIHDICFVPTTGSSKFVLAILSEDHNQRKHVVARELKLNEEELSFDHSPVIAGGFAQDDASTLIPVPGQRKSSGVLVVGGGKCHFFGSEKVQGKRASTGEKLTAVRSLAKVDTPLVSGIVYATIDENRWILGDEHGSLCILGITRSGPGGTVSDISVAELGQTAPPSSLSHITDRILYVGSSRADSQTIRLLPEAKSDGSYVEVLESYTNIGPIVDAVLSPDDNSGQREVVTCSGAGTMSSLRVIRSGAEFRPSATLEAFHNVERIFPIRPHDGASDHSLLIVSTAFATTVFQLNGNSIDEMEATDYPGFRRSEPTLAAQTIIYKRSAIQVTPSGIYIVNLMTGDLDCRWPPKADPSIKISVASVNRSQVCVALQGGKLVYATTMDGLKSVFEHRGEIVDGLPNEAASLSVEPFTPSDKRASQFIAVGYWMRNEVVIYKLDLPKFTKISTITESHAPRSLLLHNFGTGNEAKHYLIVGLGDGTVVTYAHNQGKLSGRRSLSLGPEQAVNFAPCSYKAAESDRVVLAAGARGAVIWFDKKTKRIRHSAVSVQDVSTLCALDHPSSPGSVLIASRASSTIGQLGELNKLNIRTIPFGVDNPKYIAHSPRHDVYLVACRRHDIDARENVFNISSFVKIVQPTTFEVSAQIECITGETISCMATLDLDNPIYRENSAFVVAGTGEDPPEGSIESTKGRVYVFDGPTNSADRSSDPIKIVASIELAGCVFGVAAIDGMIAAAVNSYIYVFALEKPNDKSPLRLVQKAKWDKGYMISALSSYGRTLMALDCLKSVTFLQLKDGKLETVAQNYESFWPFSAAPLSEDTTLVGEMDQNISLFKRDGETIEKIGGIHYNELVNTFIPGSIAPVGSQAAIQPKMVVLTGTGRIGIISEVNDDASIRLTELQRNLAYSIRGPGDAELSQWRTPKMVAKTSPFAGFIDGDFVEELLNLREDELQKVLAGRNQFERLSGTRDDMIGLVEQIASLH